MVSPLASAELAVLAERRDLATRLVEELRAGWPEALDAGADLGPALEQYLYFALRDGAQSPRRGMSLRSRVLQYGALGAGIIPRPRPRVASGALLIVVRQAVHVRLLSPVRPALAKRGAPHIHVVRVGAAAADPTLGAVGPRLEAHLDLQAARGLAQRRRMPSLRALRSAWQAGATSRAATLAALASTELPRLRVAAVALDAAVRRTGAVRLVTYDEVGRWGRLVSSVAATADIASVDLPHAEAVDEIAMRGAAYDAMGAFGERSVERMERAGIPRSRVGVTGNPLLDRLLVEARERGAAGARDRTLRRVVFASQYVAGTMTRAVKERTLRMAREAAAAAAPCQLVVVPHPVETDTVLRAVLAEPAPPGVEVRLAGVGTLQQELLHAWLLITGSSQSVLEAVAVEVPAITINATRGPDPVPYATEGLTLGADSVAAARDAVISLLDDSVRAEVTGRARAIVARHLGPLDGRSAERTADLILGAAPGR